MNNGGYFYINISGNSEDELNARIEDNELRGFEVYKRISPETNDYKYFKHTYDYGHKSICEKFTDGVHIHKAVMRRKSMKV